MREGRAVLTGPGDPDFDRWMRVHDEQAPYNRAYRECVRSTLAVPLMARGTALGVAVAVRAAPQHPHVDDDTV
ncbi:hypothetical protein, partial [Streptomyces sp. CHB19.2]|uniref:hypothetical protein n=1 Tax=Streptomyces sp. CHB19.2 TaxID=2841671 RepID=UPI0034D684F8